MADSNAKMRHVKVLETPDAMHDIVVLSEIASIRNEDDLKEDLSYFHEEGVEQLAVVYEAIMAQNRNKLEV